MTQFLEKVTKCKVIPVVVLDRAEDVIPLAETLVRSGLPIAEITLRSEVAVDAIRLLAKSHPEILVGAGTVLNRAHILAAKEAGAAFVVSPGLNPSTIQAARALNMPIIPGVNNPSDIECALELGLSVLKFFPAEASGGIKMLKALMGPYPNVRFMPTGGINLENIRDYLALPNVMACGASWIVEPELIRSGSWDEITRRIQGLMALLS